MITGIVNSKLEAMTGLTVIAPAQVSRHIDALIDTGYSGQLCLPPATVAALQLSFRGRGQGILADGSIQYFDVYDANVMWDGQVRAIEVDELNAQLVGMALLEGHVLQIEVKRGGDVTITASP